MANLLYGIHDREGAHILPPGGWCVDVVALSENPSPTNYSAIRGDINWITRLSWGVGTTGNIPLPHDYDKMAAACADYVARSQGCNIYIIGNEPQHENERPGGIYITPAQYAHCFRLCRDAIKRARPQTQVIPAPCAPYHVVVAPQHHANPIPWTDYWREMLTIIAANGGCDGIAVHAYTRGSGSDDIFSVERMGPPLTGQFSGFFTYRDALGAVPASLRHLPAYITEFNELLPDGWHDANTGVVRNAYGEIDWWNHQPGTQKIQCLILYRWPRYDKWHIEGKQGVIDDFNAAVAKGYTSPQLSAQTSEPEQTFIPSVSTGGDSPMPDLPRDIDPRLLKRGVRIETPLLKPGARYWRIKSARWYNEQESQGRHHIYVEAVDSDGKPLADVPFTVTWPNGATQGRTNGRSGFDGGNFPMSASLNEFNVQMNAPVPSEALKGIGMGADGNPGIHTSTSVVFEWATVPQAQPTQPTQPPAVGVPLLAHPIADPTRRIITQQFGDNPDDYAQFGLAGHAGIDFAIPTGTPIGAADSGTVLESQSDPGGYGEYIKLRHAWGESLYAHLSARKVNAGEAVNRGQVIGRSGSTGNSTGPHLHFAIRINPYTRGYPWDGFSDPLPYLPGEQPQPKPEPTKPPDLLPLIKEAAREMGIEWQLLASVAWAESSFRPDAVSATGAKGIMQLMDATWAEWAPRVGASDPFNARDSLRVGAAYLKWLLTLTGNNPYQALVAYGWGIGSVLEGKKPPKLWVAYFNKVMQGRDLLKAVGL